MNDEHLIKICFSALFLSRKISTQRIESIFECLSWIIFSPFRYSIESFYVLNKNFSKVGLRGFWWFRKWNNENIAWDRFHSCFFLFPSFDKLNLNQQRVPTLLPLSHRQLVKAKLRSNETESSLVIEPVKNFGDCKVPISLLWIHQEAKKLLTQMEIISKKLKSFLNLSRFKFQLQIF